MVNKCAALSCQSGYAKNENIKRLATFHFPLKDDELNKHWIRFVNRAVSVPTKHSVLCELHFDEKYIIRGGKCNLKWATKPIPTIHSKELLNGPQSSLPTLQTLRRSPRKFSRPAKIVSRKR